MIRQTQPEIPTVARQNEKSNRTEKAAKAGRKAKTSASVSAEADVDELLPITICVDPEARESNLVPVLASLLLSQARAALEKCA
jgi:hypothetical protein